jgi:hypothetical protein
VTRWEEKKLQHFLKNSPKSRQVKKAKISTTKLNLKTHNIYIIPLLKLENAYNKSCFETVHLGENVINLLKQKVAPKVAIILGYFIFTKNHNESPKVAQLSKIAQSGHPDLCTGTVMPS